MVMRSKLPVVEFPLLIIEQLALAYEVPADPLLDHVFCLIEIMTGLLTIGPEVLERFPMAVPPLMELTASVVVMRPGHCDSLKVTPEVFNEALEEFLKSVRFSQIEPGCIWCAHGDGFHGCAPLLLEFVRGTGKAEGIGNGSWGKSGAELVRNLRP
jgi:hypothetical protein